METICTLLLCETNTCHCYVTHRIKMHSNFQNMGNVYTGLMQAAGASLKVFEYIDREPGLKHDGKLAPEVLKGQIEFKNVSFHYPSRPDSQVLKVCVFKDG